jgi:hypothetical protein
MGKELYMRREHHPERKPRTNWQPVSFQTIWNYKKEVRTCIRKLFVRAGRYVLILRSHSKHFTGAWARS